jgi:hypothetical protein
MVEGDSKFHVNESDSKLVDLQSVAAEMQPRDVLAGIHPRNSSTTKFLAVSLFPFSFHVATPFLQASPN